MKRLGWLALLVGIYTSPAQSEQTLTPVVFQPGWFASAQFAGVFVAIDAGLYADAGLEVRVHSFAYGQDATANLEADPATCTIGSIEGYILLQKLDAGDDLIAMRPMLPNSPAGIMTFADSGIQQAADFAGKRIGVHAYADPLFTWFARNAGLSANEVEFVRVEDDLDVLIGGKVQAMLGYAKDEYVRLGLQTAERPTRFLSFADLGFPSYSEILYTTRAQHTQHADTLAAFVAATRQGWAHAFARPHLAQTAVLSRMPPDTQPDHVTAAMQALEPFVIDAEGELLPAMSATRWTDLIRISQEMGLVAGEIAPPSQWLR